MKTVLQRLQWPGLGEAKKKDGGGNGEQHADIEILKIEVMASLSFTSEKRNPSAQRDKLTAMLIAQRERAKCSFLAMLHTWKLFNRKLIESSKQTADDWNAAPNQTSCYGH